MAPPVTRSSSDTRATLVSDAIFQAINNRLTSLTQDLTDIRNDVTDLKITITGFKKEIPHTIEELTEEQQNYDERLDRLTLKIPAGYGQLVEQAEQAVLPAVRL